MRISTLKDDPAYSPHAQNTLVTLNGEPVQWCVMADDVLGEVEVYKQDELGELIIDGDELVKEKLHGKVCIVLGRVNGHPGPEARGYMKGGAGQAPEHPQDRG